MESEREMRRQPEFESETLVEAALRILNTADPFEKAKLGDLVASKWQQGSIFQAYSPSLDFPVPDRPARLANVSRLSFIIGVSGSLLNVR